MNIYIIDSTKIDNEQIECWHNDIDAIKKQKINNIKDPVFKNTRIISDHLARYAISEFTNLGIKEISFCYGKHGKPLLPGNEAYFNISHSGNFVVACVDSQPCGIDIEEIRNVNLKTAKRFCTQVEYEYIDNSDNKNIALLEIWTKKEAYFKSFGCGISTCLTAVDTLKTDGFKTFITDNYVLTTYSDSDNSRNIFELNF